MKRILVILGLTYFFFLLEFLLFNTFGRWGKPGLLIILIVFLNLYLGIRYGLICAVLSGILKDAFSFEIFGVYIFLYMSSAFLAIILRRNFYRPGSQLSRLVVTSGVLLFFFLGQVVLYAMNADIDFKGSVQFVFLPEALATLVCATFFFQKLKLLADKIRL
ncbi:MAG: rod shape-determining protein MreD [Candidatus Omnitrophica bacterium]|nr:rod shape-determining protein MreD [Candidatus Omnitrophota bacterium]